MLTFELDGTQTSWLVYADFLEDNDLPNEGIRECTITVNAWTPEPNLIFDPYTGIFVFSGETVGTFLTCPPGGMERTYLVGGQMPEIIGQVGGHTIEEEIDYNTGVGGQITFTLSL